MISKNACDKYAETCRMRSALYESFSSESLIWATLAEVCEQAAQATDSSELARLRKLCGVARDYVATNAPLNCADEARELVSALSKAAHGR